MSSLQMRGGSLSEAARRSDQAAECSAKLKVGDDLGQVSVVMKGGSSGVAADEVGRFVDGMAKEMTDALRAFSEALRESETIYNETDDKTKAIFDRFSRALERSDVHSDRPGIRTRRMP